MVLEQLCQTQRNGGITALEKAGGVCGWSDLDIRATWAWTDKSHFLITPETTGTVSKVLAPTFKCFIIQQDCKNRSVSDKNLKVSFQLEMDDESKEKVIV